MSDEPPPPSATVEDSSSIVESDHAATTPTDHAASANAVDTPTSNQQVVEEQVIDATPAADATPAIDAAPVITDQEPSITGDSSNSNTEQVAEVAITEVQEFLLLPRSLDATLAALGSSTRVRYTTFDASRTLLVFGANTGSLYVFNRSTLELIRLISLAEIRSAVTRIAISPIDENMVAVVSGQRIVHIVQLNLNERVQKEKVIYKLEQHKDDVRCAIWSTDPGSLRLFTADVHGDVYLSNVEKKVSLFFTSDLIFRYVHASNMCRQRASERQPMQLS
jgi:WD40 repeat protein